MNRNLRNINIYNTLFYLSYFLLSITAYFTRVIFIAPHINIIKKISIIIFLFICLIQSKKYKKRTLLIIIIITSLCFINYFISNDYNLLFLFLVIFASKNIEEEEFIKMDIKLKIFIVLTITILYFLGYTNGFETYRDGAIRYSFGFNHPNALGAIIASIIIEYIFLKKNKFKIIELVIISLICIFIQVYPNSRTSLVLILITLFCSLFKSKFSIIFEKKIVKKMICNSWIIFSIISFLFAYFYKIESNLGIYLNDLFSNRLRHIINFFEKYPLNLFGNHLHFVSSETAKAIGMQSEVLDNAYLRFILEYGLILFSVFSIFMKKIFKWAYYKKEYILIFILFIFTIKGISEHSIYIISNNIFLIYFKEIIFGDENNKKMNRRG